MRGAGPHIYFFKRVKKKWWRGPNEKKEEKKMRGGGKKKMGGGAGGRTNERPRTDNVTSGPQKKTAPDSADRQTHTHTSRRTWRLYD